MARQGFGRGFNPLFGDDAGGPPPFAPQTPGQGGQFAAGNTWPGAAMPMYGCYINGYPGQHYTGYALPGIQYFPTGQPGVFLSNQTFMGHLPSSPIPGPPPPPGVAMGRPGGGVMIGGHPGFISSPQPQPVLAGDFPAANMGNHQGGTGMEPGYNYFFPDGHCKMHVLRCRTPPWNLPLNANIDFYPTTVPCSTTLKELMKGFGCNNPIPKKNKVYEVQEGGNGKWYKGQSFSGEDVDEIKKTISAVGWNKFRGVGQPVVWLWITKS